MAPSTYEISARDALESEAIQAIREAVAEHRRTALARGDGPRAEALRRLVERAFAPGGAPLTHDEAEADAVLVAEARGRQSVPPWRLLNEPSGGPARVAPLADWTDADVAAFLARERPAGPPARLMRLVTAGAPGAGKTTLVARLEQHAGRTRRRLAVTDAPGGEGHPRALVAGASTADVALVLVDAAEGVTEVTRRDALIASLLRAPHMLVCVNGMDKVGWAEAAFDAIVDDFTGFAARLDMPDISFVPVSALHGDNVDQRSARMAWHDGAALRSRLEHLHIASDRNLIDLRLPVQWLIETGGARRPAGQMASGVLRPGDDLVALPSGTRTRVAAIDGPDGPVLEAFPPMSVSLRLEDDPEISRGEVLCRPQNRPLVERDLDAMVCWLGAPGATPGTRYALKHATRATTAEVSGLVYRLAADTAHREAGATALAAGEVGRVTLRTASPLAFDPYRRNRPTGGFILIDEATRETVAAGVLLGPHHERNVTWHAGGSRATRARGATIWLTGLPASGKSTIADALEERLAHAGAPAYRLDGDNLRHGLNRDLGFAAADREENVRRTGEVARLMADAGLIAIVAVVSPYASGRDAARATHEQAELDFLEVWVDTPLAECERRDPKGLYARARSGEVRGLTGIDDPYEPPAAAELRLRPEDPEPPVDRIWRALADRGLVPPALVGAR